MGKDKEEKKPVTKPVDIVITKPKDREALGDDKNRQKVKVSIKKASSN